MLKKRREKEEPLTCSGGFVSPGAAASSIPHSGAAL